MNTTALQGKLTGTVIGMVLLGGAWGCFSIVDPGHMGVRITMGSLAPEPLAEGFHGKLPFVSTIRPIDVRVQKAETEADAASKDLQTVTTRVAVNFHLIPGRVVATYKMIGDLDTVGERIIAPTIEEGVKAVSARYSAEELITRRPEVRDAVQHFVSERLQRNGIMVDEFSVTNFRFSPQFAAAIEAKTTAEQQKLKAVNDLERIKVEAEQKIVQANAEAASLKAQKQEVTAELIRLREIENQRLAIDKWNGQLPATVAGGAMPFIGLAQGK